jgi:hypothetical protein
MTGHPSVDDPATVEHLLALAATIGDPSPSAGQLDNAALV